MAQLYLIVCSAFAALASYCALARTQGVEVRLLQLCTHLARRLPLAGLIRMQSWRALERSIREKYSSQCRMLSSEELFVACFGTPLVFVAVAATLAGPLVAFAALCLVYVGVYLLGLTLEKNYHSARAQALPSLVRSLASSLGSGQTLSQAIDYIANNTKSACTPDFMRASMSIRCGSSAEDALCELAESLQAPGAETLGNILLISHQTGAPLRSLLLKCATLLERNTEYERVLQVKTAQARLSVQVVCTLPVVLVILLALISPDFQLGIQRPLGVACLICALALDTFAILIIHRLMKRALV